MSRTDYLFDKNIYWQVPFLSLCRGIILFQYCQIFTVNLTFCMYLSCKTSFVFVHVIISCSIWSQLWKVEHWRGANLPFPGHWACRWIYHWVCDAWPVWRQTYGYLPCHRASPPFGRYQITLLGDRGICMCEQLAQGCYMRVEQPGVEPAST